jgi:hypothetical protein
VTALTGRVSTLETQKTARSSLLSGAAQFSLAAAGVCTALAAIPAAIYYLPRL